MSNEKQIVPFVPLNDQGNLLAAIALSIVMVGGAAMAVMAWRAEPPTAAAQSESESATAKQRGPLMAFLKGDTTAAVSRKLEQQLPLRTRFIGLANSLRYLVFRGGGDEVKVGSSGWLYLTEEYRAGRDDAENLRTRVKLLSNANTLLREQGVALLVVPVPDKSRMQSSTVPALFGDNPHDSRYDDALNGLRAADVPVVDLREALALDNHVAGSTYYRTDTHWNQTGAKAAAAVVAKQAGALGSCSAPTTYRTTAAGRDASRPGDLIRMMGLDSVGNLWRPAPDRERAETTAAVATESAGLGNSLFGDVAVDYVLTGTSFSLRGNFHGALQQALACTVLNVAQDGAGFLDSTRSYLRDDAFKGSKPKVLIWEIPERFLTLPLDKESAWLVESGLKTR